MVYATMGVLWEAHESDKVLPDSVHGGQDLREEDVYCVHNMQLHVHARPNGCSQPRELWFFDILMYLLAYVFASGGSPMGDPASCALLGMLARIFEWPEPH